MVVACSPGEFWVALVEDGIVAELRVLRSGFRGRCGEIVLGRVVSLRPDLPAALIDLGLDRPGFLDVEDVAPRRSLAVLHQGQAVLVQVVREARADKAAGVSMRLRLPGRFLDLVPASPGIEIAGSLSTVERYRRGAVVRSLADPGEGFTLRPSAAGATADDLATDAKELRERWQAIVKASRGRSPPVSLEAASTSVDIMLREFARTAPDLLVFDDLSAVAAARGWLASRQPELVDRVAYHRETTPIFDHFAVAGDVDKALRPQLSLAGGGVLTFEHTAVATVIDVDSGPQPRLATSAAAAALELNLDAAREIARQVRLRSLAGPIVIGFIGMRRPEHRQRVHDCIAAGLRDVPDAKVIGWTRLGHLELVRRRARASLTEMFFDCVPGGGLQKKPLTVTLEALRALARAAATDPRVIALRVHPVVASVLDHEGRFARQELEARLGRRLSVSVDAGCPRDAFDIGAG